ncbi:MAG TPA: sulfite exporter TauE/SafE family protein [Cytophagaceae bacterium]|jgi:uncharacterized membrane protein YfcA|nr:sulfite exporter TauE/SafE family protein [Cytophagaceae bacterium]
MGITEIILFVSAFLAFFLSALCGGGASFIIIPILGLQLPGAQIPATISLGTAASSVSRIVVFYSNIRWDVVKWFVPTAIPAVWLGAWLLTYINPVYLELLIGIFLLSNIPFIFKSKKVDNSLQKMPKPLLSFIGLMAGFVSGLTGTIGLLFNGFYLRYGLSKEEIVATRAANELLLHLIKIYLYFLFGLLVTKVLLYGTIIAVAAVLSSFVTKKILHLLSEKLFQKIGYLTMVTAGLIMFYNSSTNLLNQNQLHFAYQADSKQLETKMQWNQRTFELDFEYEDGEFEIEHEIKLTDLPIEKQQQVHALAQQADKITIEEVYAINDHYYEVYIYKNNQLKKIDL